MSDSEGKVLILHIGLVQTPPLKHLSEIKISEILIPYLPFSAIQGTINPEVDRVKPRSIHLICKESSA